jgi:hypothetical protein
VDSCMGTTGFPWAFASRIRRVDRGVKSPRKWATKRLARSRVVRPVINRDPGYGGSEGEGDRPNIEGGEAHSKTRDPYRTGSPA